MAFLDIVGKVTTKAYSKVAKTGQSVSGKALEEPVKDLGSLPPSVLEAAKFAVIDMSLDSGGSSVAPGAKQKSAKQLG